MKNLSQSLSNSDSSKTDGEIETPAEVHTVNGVEYGIGQRKPGILYLPAFPHHEIAKRMTKQDTYTCRGIDEINGVKWWKFVRGDFYPFKKDIIRQIPRSTLTVGYDPLQDELNYTAQGTYIGPPIPLPDRDNDAPWDDVQ